MVKSYCDLNVRQCMEDGLWATQSQNGEILMSAFAQCRNVILVFSINKSRAFQGYVSDEETHAAPRFETLTRCLGTRSG